MENAAKGLLIAAGMLISLMIISLAIALFSSLKGYTTDTQKQIEENELQAFNEKFYKYINSRDGVNTEFELKIQDVVTVANLAYEYNQKYGLSAPDANNYYIEVEMPGYINLEKAIKTDYAKLLKNNIDRTFICSTSDMIFNENTGRICFIRFR